MTYELAKQLKDAGFPHDFGDMVYLDLAPGKNVGKTFLNMPTLSELIEACGDNFVGLDRTDDGWKATAVLHDLLISGDGANHAVAVAKLWLKLNNNEK